MQQLEVELEKLEGSFHKHKKVLGNLLTENESCCAVVRKFQYFVPGRFYCMQVYRRFQSKICLIHITSAV